MSIDTNSQGLTAEKTIDFLFSKLNPSFRVMMLGDKWPIIDMYVEIPYGNSTVHFFLQVKSTLNGYSYSNKSKRLLVQIDKKKLNKLSDNRIPTYLIGVDLSNTTQPIPKCYILAIRGEYGNSISSIPATSRHEISKSNLIKLQNEVIKYWSASSKTLKKRYKSNFD